MCTNGSSTKVFTRNVVVPTTSETSTGSVTTSPIGGHVAAPRLRFLASAASPPPTATTYPLWPSPVKRTCTGTLRSCARFEIEVHLRRQFAHQPYAARQFHRARPIA